MLLGSVTVGNISSFMFVSSQCFILGASFLKKIYFISCCKALFQSGGILDIEAGVSRTKTDPRMCQCWTSSNDLSQIREGMQHHQHLQIPSQDTKRCSSPILDSSRFSHLVVDK